MRPNGTMRGHTKGDIYVTLMCVVYIIFYIISFFKNITNLNYYEKIIMKSNKYKTHLKQMYAYDYIIRISNEFYINLINIIT